jgi:hypothetical protein
MTYIARVRLNQGYSKHDLPLQTNYIIATEIYKYAKYDCVLETQLTSELVLTLFEMPRIPL